MRTDRPTDDRPTFLDVNDHNFGCIQDRFVIWTANSTGSFKFTPRPTVVAMATKFETQIGYNSAYLRDIFKIRASIRGK